MITNAIRSALGRLLRLKRLLVLYWFIHTVLALLVALPLASVAVTQLSHSRYGLELLDGFDFMWLTEVYSATLGAPLMPIVMSAAAAFFLAGIGAMFLAGGSVWFMVYDAVEYTPAAFWENCGRHFWRFFRLFLYSLLFYGLALALTGGIDKLAGKLWGKGMEQRPLYYASWARVALTILLCGFVSTAMDYAKVRLVAGDSRRSLAAAFWSIRFTFRHLSRTMGVWLELTVVWLLVTSGYVFVANRIPTRTLGPIAALFVLQQAYVFARVVLRFTSWGAAGHIWKALQPLPAPPPEPLPVLVAAGGPEPALEAGAEAETPSHEPPADAYPKSTSEDETTHE